MARRVSALNNMGVKSLQRGRFQDSILSFRHAINILNAATLVPLDSTSDDDADHQGLQLNRLPLNCVKEEDLLAVSPANKFGIFSSTFGLPKIHSLHAQVGIVSGVLLYNLGLAYQMSGLLVNSSPGKPLQYLLEAHRCYKLCMAVLNTQEDNDEASSALAVLLCGTVTNLGHILSHCGNTDGVDACTEHLESLLESTNAIFNLTDEDAAFFFCTLTHLQNHCCTVAPAA